MLHDCLPTAPARAGARKKNPHGITHNSFQFVDMSGVTREFSRAQIACGSVLLLVSTFYAGVAITRMSPQLAQQAAAGERTNAQRLIMFSHESDDAHDGNDDFELGLKVIGIAHPLRENGAPALMAKFAFATAVLSDDYVPGACVLAYSLYRTGTLHRMVALVFNDLRADRRCVSVDVDASM